MVGAVILGAGLSRRMESSTSKLALKIENVSIIEHVLRCVSDSNFDRRLLIYSDHTVFSSQLARAYQIEALLNPNAHMGLSTSVKLGISSFEKLDGVMFVLADQPFIYKEDLNRLLSVYMSNKEKIIVPISDKGRGNPVIFPKKFFNELLQIDGDTGGREIIRNHECDIIEVKVEKSQIHFDIDTQEAYRKAMCISKNI
jgi:molybdenum cofactor cytidylyltransferase